MALITTSQMMLGVIVDERRRKSEIWNKKSKRARKKGYNRDTAELSAHRNVSMIHLLQSYCVYTEHM